METLALAAAATQARHLGIDVSLIEEDQAVGLLAHAWLTLGVPDAAFLTNLGACALRRHQEFFLYEKPSRHRKRESIAGAATTPCSSSSRAASSGMVMAGLASTVWIRKLS